MMLDEKEKIRLLQSYLANVESYKKSRLNDLQRVFIRQSSTDPYDALKLFKAQIEVNCYHQIIADLEKILYSS